MESNKQEKSNLLNDNPIAAQAGGSWVSKHMGSPMQMSEGSPTYKKKDPQEKLIKPYKKTRRAAQNRGDIINTKEEIEIQKAKLAAKKKKKK